MRCTPTQKNKYAVAYVAVLLALGGVAHLAPRITSAYGAAVFEPIFDAVTALFVTAALYLVMRYIAVGFAYVIDVRRGCEDICPPECALWTREIAAFREYFDFTVVRLKMGRQSGAECVFSLDLLLYAVPHVGRKTKKEAREKFGKLKIYDYTVTLGNTERMLLVFADGEGYTGALIEPDSEMKALLTSVASGGIKENGD